MAARATDEYGETLLSSERRLVADFRSALAHAIGARRKVRAS
jgi:hypothetical protein